METTEIEGQQYVLVSDMAKEKGVTKPAIFEAVRNGRIRAIRRLGLVLILAEDAEAYQRNQGGRREGAGRPRKAT